MNTRTKICNLLSIVMLMLNFQLKADDTTTYFYHSYSQPDYNGVIDLNSLGVTKIKSLTIDASASGGAQSNDERIYTSASVSFMQWYINGDAMDYGDGHCDCTIEASGINKVNDVWIADTIAFRCNFNGWPDTNTGLGKNGNNIIIKNANLGSGILSANSYASSSPGDTSCSIYATFEIPDGNQWTTFDEMIRGWYILQDWNPDASTVISGQLFTQSRNLRQDWRKGDYCIAGPQQGQVRNVQEYTKDQMETRTAMGTGLIYTCSIIDGDNSIANPDSINSTPITVMVLFAGSPVPNVSVNFSVFTGGGSLVQMNGVVAGSSAIVMTDNAGKASIKYKQGTFKDQNESDLIQGWM